MAKSYEELLEIIQQTKSEMLDFNSVLEFTFHIVDPFVESLNFSKETKTVGVLTIMAHSAEGPKPHVHIVSERFLTCIQLDEPLYFRHGKFKDSMNRKQRDLVIEFMKQKASDHLKKYSGDLTDTVWGACCKEWNSTATQPGTKLINISEGMPDYRKLK